jgi:hypothetical protein
MCACRSCRRQYGFKGEGIRAELCSDCVQHVWKQLQRLLQDSYWLLVCYPKHVYIVTNAHTRIYLHGCISIRGYFKILVGIWSAALGMYMSCNVRVQLWYNAHTTVVYKYQT